MLCHINFSLLFNFFMFLFQFVLFYFVLNSLVFYLLCLFNFIDLLLLMLFLKLINLLNLREKISLCLNWWWSCCQCFFNTIVSCFQYLLLHQFLYLNSIFFDLLLNLMLFLKIIYLCLLFMLLMLSLKQTNFLNKINLWFNRRWWSHQGLLDLIVCCL